MLFTSPKGGKVYLRQTLGVQRDSFGQKLKKDGCKNAVPGSDREGEAVTSSMAMDST